VPPSLCLLARAFVVASRHLRCCCYLWLFRPNEINHDTPTDTVGGCDCGGGGPEAETAVSFKLLAGMGVGRWFILVFVLLRALTFFFVNVLAANPRPGTAPIRPCPAVAGCGGCDSDCDSPEGSGGQDGGANFTWLCRSANAAGALALVVAFDPLLLLLFEEDVGVGDLGCDRGQKDRGGLLLFRLWEEEDLLLLLLLLLLWEDPRKKEQGGVGGIYPATNGVSDHNRNQNYYLYLLQVEMLWLVILLMPPPPPMMTRPLYLYFLLYAVFPPYISYSISLSLLVYRCGRSC